MAGVPVNIDPFTGRAGDRDRPADLDGASVAVDIEPVLTASQIDSGPRRERDRRARANVRDIDAIVASGPAGQVNARSSEGNRTAIDRSRFTNLNVAVGRCRGDVA